MNEEKLNEFLKVMRLKGFSSDYISANKKFVSHFELFYDNYDDETIQEAAEAYVEGHRIRKTDYVKAIKRYLLWTQKAIEPEREKTRGGFTRPKNCERKCFYNTPEGCTYKLGEKLEKNIRWKTCTYFQQKLDEKEEKDETLLMKSNRRIAYRDSHSIMYK